MTVPKDYFGVTPSEVKDAGWADDADWPVADWQYEVANGDTRLGYWLWVKHNRECAAAEGDLAIRRSASMNPYERNLELYRNYIERNLDRIDRGGWTPIGFAEFCGSEERECEANEPL